MFELERYVIHPRHGAGKVVEISELPRSEERQTFYIIKPLLKEFTLRIPIETAEQVGLRPPLDQERIEEHLGFLSEPREERSDFLRTTKISEKLDLSDPLKLLAVIKSLFYEKIYRQRDGKSLSLTKRRYYSSAISLYASEIVACRDCCLEEARFVVRKSLVFKPLED